MRTAVVKVVQGECHDTGVSVTSLSKYTSKETKLNLERSRSSVDN